MHSLERVFAMLNSIFDKDRTVQIINKSYEKMSAKYYEAAPGQWEIVKAL